MSKEIIELLEKIRKWVDGEGGMVCLHKYGLCKHDNDQCPLYCIDQALTKLREAPEQPPAGEFTKEWRNKAENLLVLSHLAEEGKTDVSTDTGKSWTLLAQGLLKACDRLDNAEAINKEKTIALANELEDCKPYAGAMQMRKALEAINTDLREACEKVQDWLNTSSLQKILVHFTAAKEKDALIMGVASHLERLEDAIAKAKEE